MLYRHTLHCTYETYETKDKGKAQSEGITKLINSIHEYYRYTVYSISIERRAIDKERKSARYYYTYILYVLYVADRRIFNCGSGLLCVHCIYCINFIYRIYRISREYNA